MGGWTSELTRRTGATGASLTLYRLVLRGRALAGALASRTGAYVDSQSPMFPSNLFQDQLTARAAGTRNGILSGSLVAGAVESTLLATGALGLGSADAASILGGLAAGGRGVDHFEGVVDMTSV